MTSAELQPYMAEIRAAVCARCIDRPANGPPCAFVGKPCGIEHHFEAFVEICHSIDSALIDPYIERLHDVICATCVHKDYPACPCPLDYLVHLAVEAVEAVDRRRVHATAHVPIKSRR